MAPEALDLSTIGERVTVRVVSKLHTKGKVYELLNPQELSLWQAANLERVSVGLKGYDLEVRPTPAKARAYTKSLRDLVATVAPTLEEKVLEALSDVQLLAIYGVFGSGDSNAEGTETTPGNGGGA